ncbi:hypothetical protein C6502_13295 [Candidatus Poribacteria bacterium]|nr:MAG: hypothetical protein C6502_13295 [Candidatus Poribacteria bacterium]
MIDDERTQFVLWLSTIAFLVIVLLVVLGCAASVLNAQSGLNLVPVVAGADPAVEDNRSATPKIERSPPIPNRFETAALQIEALVAAEQDASRDVNKLGWFGAGVATSVIIGPLAAYAGNVIGGKIAPATGSGLLFYDAVSDGEIIGTFTVFFIGVSGPLILIYNYNPDPPSKRFVGQPPEYIDYYTMTYKTKAKSIRK